MQHNCTKLNTSKWDELQLSQSRAHCNYRIATPVGFCSTALCEKKLAPPTTPTIHHSVRVSNPRRRDFSFVVRGVRAGPQEPLEVAIFNHTSETSMHYNAGKLEAGAKSSGPESSRFLNCNPTEALSSTPALQCVNTLSGSDFTRGYCSGKKCWGVVTRDASFKEGDWYCCCGNFNYAKHVVCNGKFCQRPRSGSEQLPPNRPY